MSVYRGTGGIQALMQGNARKLAEKDESIVTDSGIPYTIIRAGLLQNTPGGKEGFSFKEVFFQSAKLTLWPSSFHRQIHYQVSMIG